MKHEQGVLPDEATVREGLRLARVLRITRLEAATRLRKTIIGGGGADVPALYAHMIRFETGEQWENVKVFSHPEGAPQDTTMDDAARQYIQNYWRQQQIILPPEDDDNQSYGRVTP